MSGTTDYRKNREKRLAQKRLYYRKNIDKIRAYRHINRARLLAAMRCRDLKRHYGITCEQYDALVKAQGGKCANVACGATKPGGKGKHWHVDHDHKTQEVRGLLCHKCNTALGLLREDPVVIDGLKDYLRAWSYTPVTD